ncbi:MAG: hypothetical protein WCX17_01025 [Parcubacteria group bacterium]|jgi:hypothetical protein
MADTKKKKVKEPTAEDCLRRIHPWDGNPDHIGFGEYEEVHNAAERLYDDLFGPVQDSQPQLARALKRGVTGLDPMPTGRKGKALPKDSIFTKKYILDSIGI